MTAVELTTTQQEVLEFERRWPRYNADKVRAVEEFFGFTMAEYERLLDLALELPAAQAYDSALVEKVQRERRGQRWYLERQHDHRRWV